MRKLFFLAFIFIFLIPSIFSGHATSQVAARSLPISVWKIDPELQAELNGLEAQDMITVIITLAEQADLTQIPGANRAARLEGVIKALKATAQASQRPIQAMLASYRAQGRVGQVISFWVFNGLSVTTTRQVVQELASRSDVYRITTDAVDIVQTQSLVLNTPEPNITLVNAPELWNLGYYGQGVVIASMDTGVDVTHPDLATSYRDGGNSWFDPYYQHATPYDMNGHGTQTMGVIVGGDAGGTTIGMAPQAQWIAAKIFNDAGSATSTAIHQAFQWLLDPDGNPSTDDAPQVVNNSWAFGTPGCNLEFQLDLQALLSAEILPVFSAGNFGPNASTSVSPANYPEAFAVGAMDNNDLIYAYSSRGPSACGEETSVYPELVAPGVNVKSADRFASYTYATGTSLAAPHVSGSLALLLSAYPNINATQQRSALINGALDLGLIGPDNDFGFGRLDVLAAYQWLEAGGANSTSTPTASPTPTPDPTINLALNKSVMVSSAQDEAHNGAMAVDGNLESTWQTATARGKNKLPVEWITIDLGSSMSIARVVLDWDANYATSYSLQVSNDNASWSTVFSTNSGDGAVDSLVFNPTAARFVKLNTTAWNSGSLRNWLKEISAFADGAILPTPTPTPMPSPTPTPPGDSLSMHMGDLDGTAAIVNPKNWAATVTLWVHDLSENSIANASVYGTWSGGTSGSSSCITDASGSCQIISERIKNSYPDVSFTVTDVVRSADTYEVTANHDPDGDSDGTRITILKP